MSTEILLHIGWNILVTKECEGLVMLDQYVQRLQNISSFDIYAVNAEGKVAPWYTVDGTIMRDLVIRETDLALQVQTVASQIAHWGRMVAQTKRVWEIEERHYRSWRSGFVLEKLNPPEGKAPSMGKIEAMYRTEKTYHELQKKVERAEEAYEASKCFYEAFRAKRDMLKAVVFRSRDDGSVQMSV